MPITKETPLVIPATEEKTLPHTWISSLTASAPNSFEGYLHLELTPFNADSGEDPDPKNAYHIHADLWEIVEEVPEAAAALEAIYAAIPAIESYHAASLLPEEPIEEAVAIDSPALNSPSLDSPQ